jgi:hypothetical protein
MPRGARQLRPEAAEATGSEARRTACERTTDLRVRRDKCPRSH